MPRPGGDRHHREEGVDMGKRPVKRPADCSKGKSVREGAERFLYSKNSHEQQTSQREMGSKNTKESDPRENESYTVQSRKKK